MGNRTRGERRTLTEKERIAAKKIALLLAESKACVTNLEEIWEKAKSILKVSLENNQ